MSSIPTMYNRNEDGITGVTFILGTQPYMADASLPTFSELLDELKKGQPDEARLIALTEPATAIIEAVAAAVDADYLPAGKVSVTRSEVRYDGEQVEGVLVDRILTMLAEGFDIMPMVRFLEKLYLNPATYARDELYLWLENSNLPITEDGDFLAYKMVSDDYTSRGGFKNPVGEFVSMPRQACDPVRDHLCSTGLHFCSKEYIGVGHTGKIVILKINPADVVSIPSDYGNSKGRAWKYFILSDFEGDAHTKVWSSVVDSDGNDYGDVDDWDDHGDDDHDDLLEFPSELAGALFAAYAEIADDPKDRDERLAWAGLFLYGFNNSVDSFSELTKDEASQLIAYAREVKADLDAEADETVAQAQADAEQVAEEAAELAIAARQAKIDAINKYGIIALRQKTGKWKGHKAAELRAILIAQV